MAPYGLASAVRLLSVLLRVAWRAWRPGGCLEGLPRMRHAATLARRPLAGGGGFLLIHQHELEALDTLDLWTTRLFQALVRISDYKTGFGQTTLKALVLQLTPIQPRSGPRLFVPGVRLIRATLATFESRLLMTRDKALSARGECLFFHVDPRTLEARLDRNSAGDLRRPPVSRIASNDAGSRPVMHRTPPGNSAAYSRRVSTITTTTRGRARVDKKRD